MFNNHSSKRVTISVITNHQDLVAALMVRSAVFVGEIGIPLEVAADGNDFCATQLLASVDGKPAGTMRIRYFKDVAVLERLAVLKEHRLRRYGSRGVAWELGEYAVNFCRVKGYTKFYGTSRDNLIEFWKRFAPEGAQFELIPNAEKEYAGHPSYPMEGWAPPLPNAVNGLDDIELLGAIEATLPAAINSMRLSQSPGPA